MLEEWRLGMIFPLYEGEGDIIDVQRLERYQFA